MELLEVVVRNDDVGVLGQDVRSQLLPVLGSLESVNRRPRQAAPEKSNTIVQ